MQYPYSGGEDSWWKTKIMTRLLYFTRIQERRREGVFVCLGMNERGGGVYIVMVDEI